MFSVFRNAKTMTGVTKSTKFDQQIVKMMTGVTDVTKLWFFKSLSVCVAEIPAIQKKCRAAKKEPTNSIEKLPRVLFCDLRASYR